MRKYKKTQQVNDVDFQIKKVRDAISSGTFLRNDPESRKLLKNIKKGSKEPNWLPKPSKHSTQILRRISNHVRGRISIIIDNKKKGQTVGTDDTGPYNKI